MKIRVLLGAALAVLLALVGLQLLAGSLSFERLRPALEARLSRAIGLEVSLGGELRLDPWALGHLEVDDVTVANLPGRPSPHLLTVGEVRLDLELWPLLRRVVSIERIELIDAELRIEPDAEGRFPLSPDLEPLDDPPEDGGPEDAGGRAAMRLDVREVRFEGLRVFYDPAGGKDVVTLVLDELEITTDGASSPIQVSTRGTYEGSPIALEAEVGSARELLTPSGPYPLRASGRVPGADLELEGAIDEPRALRGVDLAFMARLDDLGRTFTEMRLPDLGPVRASGRLRNPDGVFGIEALEVETEADAPVRIVVKGRVRDVADLGGIDVQVHTEVQDIDVLEALATVPLPHLPASADLHVSDDDGSLGLEGEAEAGSSGSLELALRGAYDDVRGLSELDVGILLGAPDLQALRQSLELELGRPLPKIGPVRAQASLRDHDGAFGLDEIDVLVGERNATWVAVTGSIRDLQELRGVRLEMAAGGIETRHLAASVGRELPDLGALELSASLSDEDGTLGVERATARGGHEQLFRIELHGAFDDLRELDEIEVEAKLFARDLAVLGELVGRELPAAGPVTFSGRVRGSDERLETHGELDLGRTKLLGNATASFAPDVRPRLTARVRSPAVFLEDVGVAPDAGRPAAPSAFERWWSGAQPARLEALREIDLDVRLEADRLAGRNGLLMQNVLLYLKLDDGRLVVRETGARYEGGEIEIEIDADARPAEPRWGLRVEAYSVDLTKLMSQFQESPGSAGLLDLSLDLHSGGTTRSEVTSRLEGKAGAMLRDGALVSRYSRAFSINFLRLTVPDFLGDPQGPAPVHCLLARFPVEEGLATAEQLYLETEEITVDGQGTVDLARDRLDLRLTPHLHEPGLVSIAATVDISGPIQDPVLRPVASSLGTSAVRGLVRNVLRPVRAVLDRRPGAEDAPDPCDAMAVLRQQEQLDDDADGGPAYEPGTSTSLAPAGG